MIASTTVAVVLLLRAARRRGAFFVPAAEGLLTLAQCLDDEREAQKCHEHDVELVEATEDSAKALEPAEQPLDLVAPTIPGFAVRPGLDAVDSGGTTGMKPSSSASWRVSLPSYALSMISRQCRGRSGSVRSRSRPAGASPACPGVRENAMAHRASAATI